MASIQQQQQQQRQSQPSNNNNSSTTTTLDLSDETIQWADIFNKKVLFFVFVTGPVWVMGHLIDRSFAKLFVAKFIPANFDIHGALVIVSQLFPTCTHILIYICNATSFKHLFDLETTMDRVNVPVQFQPLFRKMQPRNLNEFNKAEAIMNNLVQELASSGIEPHSMTIYDVSSPARPHFQKQAITASSTSKSMLNNSHHNNNNNDTTSRFAIFSRLFGGRNTIHEMSPIREQQQQHIEMQTIV